MQNPRLLNVSRLPAEIRQIILRNILEDRLPVPGDGEPVFEGFRALLNALFSVDMESAIMEVLPAMIYLSRRLDTECSAPLLVCVEESSAESLRLGRSTNNSTTVAEFKLMRMRFEYFCRLRDDVAAVLTHVHECIRVIDEEARLFVDSV